MYQTLTGLVNTDNAEQLAALIEGSDFAWGDTNALGDTLLHIACRRDARLCVSVLVEHGIDTSIRNAQHQTAEEIAVDRHAIGVLRALRQAIRQKFSPTRWKSEPALSHV